ncbi:MAG TPA: SBBP repeat-containing protein [Bryobacteraceae bacterium]|nr:SBBP repeat-containing protein [Bryobacteraceae bacterium]
MRAGFGQSYTISTVAGTGWDLPGLSANLANLEGVAVDGAGNVFMSLATYSVVVRLDLSGQLSLVAGNGTLGFSGDGGRATLAQLSQPTAVAVDAAGNVYIEDAGNNRIRMVSNGIITTIAGGGTGDDGPATGARLSLQLGPGLALDTAGNIYFADFSNLTRIRKVSNGVISTVAGGGFSLNDNIPATSALIDAKGVAVDSAGSVYFADDCGERIRKVSNGTITSVAGNGQEGFLACAVGASGPDTGKATSVPLDTPRAVAVDAAGNIYFTEGGAGPSRVRKVSNGSISTVAGGNSGLLSGPARGDNIPATSATLEFAANNTIAIDSAGNLYIPDEYWVTPPPGGVYHGDIESAPEFGRLRKVSNGVITTLAGSSIDSGSATGAQLNLPAGVAVDGTGNLYIADGNGIVREVSNGFINTIAGTRVSGGCGCDSGIPSGVSIYPTGIAVDSNGNVFIAGGVGLELSLAGRTSPAVNAVASPSGPGGLIIGVALDTAGSSYFTNFLGNQIQELSNGVLTTIAGTTQGYSGDNGPAASAQLSNPSGITVDSAGNVYFAEIGNQVIRKISRGVITTVAGNGTAGFSGDGGPATSAQLNLQSSGVNCCLPVNPSPRLPGGIAVDPAGNLFIADSGNQRVRMVSNGVITTIAGTGTPGFSGDGGPAASAEFYNPSGIAIDAAGKIYVSDSSNGRIRLLTSNCTFNVGPLSVTVPAAGGTFPIVVQASASCTWSVAGLPSWITLSTPLPGAGPATVDLVVAANTGAPRTASLTIAGQPVFIGQAPAPPPCTYNVSPSFVQIPPAGGTFTLTTQTLPYCTWSITGAPTWIFVPPLPQPLLGSGNVLLMVAPNQNPVNIAHLVVAGQTVTVTEGPAPGFGPVISSVTTAGGESLTISPNTWVEIKGANVGLPENRTWQNTDFVNGQMPTSLDGISVSMNGESAYIYYLGPNQIDVLTPPDLASGPVQFVVTVATVSSPQFASHAQPLSPSLFVFNGGPYVAAAHADGSLLGPAGLYPGSTPAKPGETILLFANGFGPVSLPIIKGSVSQSGILSPLPAITIGGVTAAVSFAGLVAPGEFQFNVTVPSSLGNGDQSIVAAYGQTTQAGTLITVHN